MANFEDSNFLEDPLEQLLDEESDEEFGLPVFGDKIADSGSPVVLRDWSAKDFSNIYVRFRPHLVRHARRFLVNPSQVDEVVQDAFLYLMTTLPELDSEVGVLRFLKWKTRLLALDVIRANSRVSLAPLDDQPEFAADLPEHSKDLERAEDAAIVSLALAKLLPRQREALIATIYEEKSTEVVAAQLGLSENATRQLLFRARSAFKRALIGEAETQGLSISQILSIAARKAAAESGKYISAAGALLLVLAIGVGILPNLPQGTQETVAAPTNQVTSPSKPIVTEAPAEAEQPEAAPGDVVEPVSSGSIQETVVSNGDPVVAPAIQVTPSPGPTPATSNAVQGSTTAAQLRKSVATALGTKAISQLSSQGGSSAEAAYVGDTLVIRVANGDGLSVTFEYIPTSQEIVTFARAGMELGEASFIAVPESFGATKVSNQGLTSIYLGMSDFLIADATGKISNLVWEDVPLSRSVIRVAVTLDEASNIIGTSLTISSK